MSCEHGLIWVNIMAIRCIIAGSRGFNDYAVLLTAVNICFLSFAVEDITIISGTARGADQMGERFAREMGIALDQYPAQWDVYGRSAGYKRNELMATESTHLIAFWDGVSRGTKHMIDLATKHGLKVRVFDYDGKCCYAVGGK